MSQTQTDLTAFGSIDEQEDEHDGLPETKIPESTDEQTEESTELHGSKNSDEANEQTEASAESRESENPEPSSDTTAESSSRPRPEDSGSTIDRVLAGQDSGPGGAGNKGPDDFDLPHPLAREWAATRHNLKWTSGTTDTYTSYARTYLSYLEMRGEDLLSADYTDLVGFVRFRVNLGSAKGTVQCNCSAVKDIYQYIDIRTDAEPEIEPYVFNELNLKAYEYTGGFERGSITRDELHLLFDHFENPRDRLMTYFAVVTGVRNSDIRSLRLEDIDYDGLKIHISNPKNGEPYHSAMTLELASRLRQWEQIGRKAYPTAEKSEYVFPSARGEKLETNEALNKIIKQAAERAGIQEVATTSTYIDSRDLRNESQREIHRVTPHTLRHTFVTLLEKNGASLESRRLAANHEDSKDTEHYGDDEPEWHDDIRDFLDL